MKPTTAIVLGGLLEQNFMTAMLKAQGDLLAFFDRPVAAVVGVVTLLVWATPFAAAAYRRLRHGPRAAASGEPAARPDESI